MSGRDFSQAGKSDVLDVGDGAPEFTLRRTFEESVVLSDFLARGPVVLVFYVFDYGEY